MTVETYRFYDDPTGDGISATGNAKPDRKAGWTKVDDTLLNRRDIDSTEKLVLSIMIRLSAKEGFAWISVVGLASMIGMTEKATRRAINRLTKAGHLKRCPQYRDNLQTTNHWFVNIQPHRTPRQRHSGEGESEETSITMFILPIQMASVTKGVVFSTTLPMLPSSIGSQLTLVLNPRRCASFNALRRSSKDGAPGSQSFNVAFDAEPMVKRNRILSCLSPNSSQIAEMQSTWGFETIRISCPADRMLRICCKQTCNESGVMSCVVGNMTRHGLPSTDLMPTNFSSFQFVGVLRLNRIAPAFA